MFFKGFFEAFRGNCNTIKKGVKISLTTNQVTDDR